MTVNSRSDPGFTTSNIGIGPGQGDYDLVVCSIETDGANPFELPTPGNWNELDNGTCVDPDCQLGIWGRANLNPVAEDINYSWQDDTRGFVAGSIRYSGVDTINPIIDMVCSEVDGQELVIDSLSSEPGAQIVVFQTIRTTGNQSEEFVSFDSNLGLFVLSREYDQNQRMLLLGTTIPDETGAGLEAGNTATAPSITTEAGSQVVRIFNSFAFIEGTFNERIVTPQMASITAETTVDGGQVSSIVRSVLVNSGGATGTADQVYMGSPRDWRACTIALRMLPDPPTMPPPTIAPPPPTIVPPIVTDVPTLSQWGHLSIALFLVLIEVWFLRRHKQELK